MLAAPLPSQTQIEKRQSANHLDLMSTLCNSYTERIQKEGTAILEYMFYLQCLFEEVAVLFVAFCR